MSEQLTIPNNLSDPVKKNKSLDRLAMRVFTKGGSNRTVELYVVATIYFCKWLSLEPDTAIKTRYDWPAKINDYFDYLINKRQTSRSTARSYMAGVMKWLRVNGIEFDEDRIEIPKKWKFETDQIPTRPELKQALSAAGLAERVFALIGISSGLRMDMILSLQLKHVDLTKEVPAIKISSKMSKNRRSFVTFLTPEAAEVLKGYLKEREFRGDTIGPDSFVIVGERPLGERITGRAGRWKWQRTISRVGLAVKGRKWYTLHFHTLRKYFKTWSSLSGVNGDVVEFFMGHRASIAQTYFVGDSDNIPTEIIARLEVEYRKALPALTIMSEGEKVKELEESIEELRDEADKRKREAEEKEQALREKVSLIEKLEYRLAKLERKLDRELEKQTLRSSSQ